MMHSKVIGKKSTHHPHPTVKKYTLRDINLMQFK